MGERGEIIPQSLQQLPWNFLSSMAYKLTSFLHNRPTWPTWRARVIVVPR